MIEKKTKVFISYSHDSSEHKQWVAELATKLRHNGIDAILDQWDLGLGDEITKFMEDGLIQSDRVLLICTENYVRKAEAGKGGVAYERMIVTAELIGNLGTQKFIPVIKQKSESPQLPKFLGQRYYINLSDEKDYEENFETLLRELHKQPKLKKLPIGKNPFEVKPSRVEIPEEVASDTIISIKNIEKQNTPEIYNKALDIARQGDLVAWRKIIKRVKNKLRHILQNYREVIEKNPANNEEELLKMAEEGIELYSPLFSIVLAGIESRREEFSDQRALLDEILNPYNWKTSGLTYIVDFPRTIAFAFQAIHGAICLDTNQLKLALNFAKMKIESNYSQQSISLYKWSDIIGYPKSFGGKCTNAWKFLNTIPDRWDWVLDSFGSKEDYQVSLYGYYMALHILELTDTIASGKENILSDNNIILDIPLCFLREPEGLKKKAYNLLLSNKPQQIWESFEVTQQKMERFWSPWLEHAKTWISTNYPILIHWPPAYESLFRDLINSN